MPTLGPIELGIILLVILIVFGPGKLPQVMKTFGNGIREFKDAMSGTSKQDPPTGDKPSD